MIGGDNGNGYYDSQNSNLTRAELLEMRKVGIGFILISWWGSNATNARDNYTDVSARTVFDVLRNNPNDFRGMKAAILVENYPTRFPNKPNLYKVDPGNISAVYSYISDEFVQKFPDQYFYWNGKPLILFFSPQWIVLNSIRQSPDYAQFSTRTLGDETFIDWRFAEETPVLSPDGFVTVMPRFDSYYLFKSGCRTNAIRIDVNLDYLYAQQWNAIIGRKSDLGIVAIYSWNEYHERTEIEPHMDASLKPPFQLYFQTEHYVDQIKS